MMMMASAVRGAVRGAGVAPGRRAMSTFRALVTTKDPADRKAPPSHEVVTVGSVEELPCQPDAATAAGGLVQVAVSHSCLNYKDGIVLNGLPGVAKGYPIVGGIDLAGEVEVAEAGSGFAAGQPVVLTGHYCGQHMDGGYAQKCMVPAEWLVPLPAGLSPQEAMAVGTAGFTAMQSVMHLEAAGGLDSSNDQPVLVTGAAGGVGSLAVSILSNLGYNVVASSTRFEEEAEFLRGLGASDCVGRFEAGAPLAREVYQGVVDTVGGATLANVLPHISYGRAVSTCGVAAGPKLEATMFPFILRGVRILGIDSVQAPADERAAVWKRVVTDLPLDKLQATVSTIGLDDVPAAGKDILAGKVRGRVVVDVNM